ncbi:NEDD8-conjugating enzyme Ubc12-like [Ptychodera flava]|uniref:NEDD8-conjugating enzyme Ubc12-like n=1 Tax=Ptychodera flava TaxID=63121 RepID=UPI00396A3417
MSHKRLAKQFHRLLKNIVSFSDGQAEVIDFSDSLEDFTVRICPSGGLYKNAEFIFKVELDERYPTLAPTVSCETPIYHPNIDAYEGNLYDNVCVNILTDWSPDVDLEGVVQALLFLFYQPNLDDPLSEMFTATRTVKEYEDNVKRSLEGGIVDGFLFERNVHDEKRCWKTVCGDKSTRDRKGCAVTVNCCRGDDQTKRAGASDCRGLVAAEESACEQSSTQAQSVESRQNGESSVTRLNKENRCRGRTRRRDPVKRFVSRVLNFTKASI